MQDAIQAIQAKEAELQAAMLKADVEALDALIDEGLVFTAPTGQVVSKADDLAIHRDGVLVFNTLTLSEQHIVPLVDAAVVSVTADIESVFQGQVANGRFKFTRVWALRDGDYKVVAGHASLLAGPA